MTELIKLYQPETVFSLIFFIIIIGFGWWFTRSFWPWLLKYMEHKVDLEHQRELVRIEADAENERKWHDVSEKMTEALVELKSEVSGFREALMAMSTQNEMIYKMFAKINESDGEE